MTKISPPAMRSYATLERCKKYASDYAKNERCVNERVQSFIYQNLKLPKQVFDSSIGATNRLLVSISSGSKGSTYEVLNKNADPYLIEAVMKALEKFPEFIPGVDIKGNVIPSGKILPIIFNIPNR